jgi:uncharacterized protein YfiM (DUF2279 family)
VLPASQGDGTAEGVGVETTDAEVAEASDRWLPSDADVLWPATGATTGVAVWIGFGGVGTGSHVSRC